MTKRIRQILFWACLGLFILFTPLIILYSQGYKFDFDSPAGGKIIVQTGGLALKISPKSSEIYIDGKLIKEKTSMFSNSVFINNLLPKKYNVEVKKENYNSWQKNLEVKEKTVTEAKNIILFPTNLKFSPLIKNIEDFWLSPHGNKLMIKEINKKGHIFKIYDLEKESEIVEGDEPLETDFDENKTNYYLDKLGYFYKENNNLYFFKNGTDDSEKIFDSVNSIRISPDSQKVLYCSDSEIWLLQPEKEGLKKTFLLRLSEKINDCLWFDSDYFIFSAGGKIKIAETDIRDKINIAEISDKNSSKIIFTEKTNQLYVLQNKTIFQSELLIEQNLISF